MKLQLQETFKTLSLLIILSVEINGQSLNCGSTNMYYGSSGMIYSPNYPSNYYNSLNCTYTWNVPALSSVSLTIQVLDMERSGSSCPYDWVQLSCRSHSVTLPTRYCGTGSNLNPLTFSTCSQIVIWLKTDGSATGRGYAISYRADPIECPGNCTVVVNSYGYVCSCDSIQTTGRMPTMNPSPRCMGGCTLTSPSNSYLYCLCSVYGSISQTTPRCPYGCYSSYDYYGYPTCVCSQVTTSAPCPSGCYRTTDWLGYPYCSCPSSNPLSCPYGCIADFDYYGNQFCNCQRSTQPPIWCSSGCVSDINVYGARYCRCPSTTLPPCFSPCYYTWDYTYDYAGRRICYCPPTTTRPPPTGCNQTLTAPYGTVTSPNYPNAYTRGIDCYQHISVPMATTITIRVVEMSIYYSSSSNCLYEYVEITGCDGFTTRFCVAYTIPTSGLVLHCTDHSLVTVRFHSYNYYYSGYTGFKLTYSAGFSSNCSDSGIYLTQGSTGVIASPNYPNNFPAYGQCLSYLFTDDSNIKIKITFEQLRLEESTTCRNVFLTLVCLDGGDYIQTVCGSRLPGPITVECQTLEIWFKSNASTSFTPRNYKLRYYAVMNSPTVPTGHPPPQADPHSDVTGLPQVYKIGLGLGVGVGGFLLIILIVVIVVIVVVSQRQTARREQRHLEALAVMCRNINGGRGSDQIDSVRIRRGPPTRHLDGSFTNPMMDEIADDLPSYSPRVYGVEAVSPLPAVVGSNAVDDADTAMLIA